MVITRTSTRAWLGTGGYNAAAVLLAAVVSLSRAFASTPYDPGGPYAEAYVSGKYQAAIETYEKAIEAELGQPPVLWAADHAELLFLAGRYDEAIAAMGEVVRRVYEPVFTVRLAEMYRYVGRASDARNATDLAIRQSQSQYPEDYPRENLLAIGRVARMQGENPRNVLQVYQQRLLQRHPDFVPGFVAAGELALESYGYDVAEEYFLEALALDATRQSALAGLAETYYKAEDPRFEEVAARLEALNPHHPRLQCILIERALMAGDGDKATALLDDLLGINPVHHAGLAYRAASAFLAGDTALRDASLARLAELRPDSGDGYRILGDLAARHYRFDEAAVFLRQALSLDPESGPAKASLGLNLLRLGEDATGRVILEEVFEADPYNVQVFNMLEVLDTLDGFKSVADADFLIRLPDVEASVMGPEVLALLGEALERYSRDYAVDVKRPVHVQIFDDHDDFMVRSIGLPGNAGHLGICFGNLVTLDSPRARDPQTMNWRSVLWHEFVHVITLQKTGNRIPRWLSEGISVFEERQRDPAWGQPLAPEFKPLLSRENWPALDSLETYFVNPESPDHLMLGYFLAGAFVEAYVDAYGKPALVAALDGIREGKEANAALVESAGGGAEALNGLFAAHLERVCAPLAQLAPPEEPDAGAPEAVGPFVALLEAGAAALEAGDEAKAIAEFESAAALFPSFPGEMNPLRRLVEIRRRSGDLETWYQSVLRLQSHDPTAYAESVALMVALEKAGAWPRVRELADWCAGVDPFDTEVCQMRRRAEQALGDHEGLVKTLARLAVLDRGQAEVYQIEMARALRALSRGAEARQIVLTLLERYPEYREAQQLLLELHEQGGEVGRDHS